MHIQLRIYTKTRGHFLRFVKFSVQLPSLWYPFPENNSYIGGPELQSLFLLLREVTVLCLAPLPKLESDPNKS